MGVWNSTYKAALKVFKHLPVRIRRLVVRSISPSYTVGAMCFIHRPDGHLLMVRHTYRERWGVPGGLLNRGESKEDAAIREVLEETGLAVEIVAPPAVVVDPGPQRVDLIFPCRPVDGTDTESVRPTSPEIAEVRWFPVDHLPELQFETAGALELLKRLERN